MCALSAQEDRLCRIQSLLATQVSDPGSLSALIQVCGLSLVRLASFASLMSHVAIGSAALGALFGCRSYPHTAHGTLLNIPYGYCLRWMESCRSGHSSTPSQSI